MNPPCQLTLTFPPLGKGGFATGNHRPFRQGRALPPATIASLGKGGFATGNHRPFRQGAEYDELCLRR